MPVMDGLTAVRKIREQSHFEKLPVIAMTANVMSNEIEAAMEAGMTDYVAKPVDVKLLFSAMAKWITPRNPVPEAIVKEPVEEPADDGVPKINSINTQAGLERTRGNVASYKKLLHRFYQNQKDAVLNLREAESSNDYDTAVRLAHTIKGVSATIGAETISEKSAKIEKKLKSQESVQEELSELNDLIKHVMFDLEKANLDKSPDAVQYDCVEKDYSEEEVESAVNQLISLLESYSAESGTFLVDNKGKIAKAIGAKNTAELSEKIDGYNFPAGLELIKSHCKAKEGSA